MRIKRMRRVAFWRVCSGWVVMFWARRTTRSMEIVQKISFGRWDEVIFFRLGSFMGVSYENVWAWVKGWI